MFKRILIALDAPKADCPAHGVGMELAALGSGQVLLFHALFPGEGGAPMPPGGDIFFVPGYVPDPAIFKAYQDHWMTYRQGNQDALDQLAALSELETTVMQIQGTPGRSICEAATQWGADVIVVGRHYRSAVSELFMGSVSNYVLHHATCAVVVVPA